MLSVQGGFITDKCHLVLISIVPLAPQFRETLLHQVTNAAHPWLVHCLCKTTIRLQQERANRSRVATGSLFLAI
jgi:hypothetical protein